MTCRFASLALLPTLLLLPLATAGCAPLPSPASPPSEVEATTHGATSRSGQSPFSTTLPKPSVTVLPGDMESPNAQYVSALKQALERAGYAVVNANAQCLLTPSIKLEGQETAKRKRMMPGFGLEVAAIKAVIGAGKYLYDKEFVPVTADTTLRIQCGDESVELTRHYEHQDSTPEDISTEVAREQVRLLDAFVAENLNAPGR